MFADIQLKGTDLVEAEFCTNDRAKRMEGGCVHAELEPCVPALHTSPHCLPG